MRWWETNLGRTLIESAPQKRAPRVMGRSFNAGINDTQTGRWRSLNESSNRELRYQLRVMRAKSRDLTNNNEYAARFIDLCSQNIIGPDGFCMEPIGKNGHGKPDKQNNELIEDAWERWGRKGTCTLDGQLSWLDLQHLVAESVARDGEILLRPIMGPAANNEFGFRIQVLEADYLDDQFYGNNDSQGAGVVMGVEHDAVGRVVAYYLLTYNPADYGYAGNANRTRVPAADLIHVFLPRRGHQRRGYPWMAPAMRALFQLGDFKDSELTATRVAAAKMGFYTKGEMAAPGEFDEQTDDGTPVAEVEPGMFEELPTGWDFKTVDWAHPNIQFSQFVKTCLQGGGVGMGVPYHELTGDLEGANYSSLREGRLSAVDMWRKRQRWFTEWVCQPIFSRWLDMATTTGALPLPPSKTEAFRYPRWQARGWQWVDPLKEAEANRVALALNLKSRREILAEQGRDLEDVLEQIEEENALIRAAGLNPLVTLPGGAVGEPNSVGSGDGGNDPGTPPAGGKK